MMNLTQFGQLARPAMLWTVVAINLIYAVVVSLMMLTGHAQLDDATALIMTQLGAITAPATAYVYQRSEEKKLQTKTEGTTAVANATADTLKNIDTVVVETPVRPPAD